MTDPQNSAPDGTYMYTLERENKELQQAQVRRINDTLEKVQRISMESQQFARTAIVEEVQRTISAEEEPVFYVESPGTIERVGSNGKSAPGRFCLPEPDVSAVVSKVIDRAFLLIEKERLEFRPKKNSPVVKRWRIL